MIFLTFFNLSIFYAIRDGRSISRSSKRQHMRQGVSRQYNYVRSDGTIKKSALMNRDPLVNESIIPRTQRITREQTKPPKPEEFAQIIIEKLERVKREQDNQEILERKLREVDRSNDNLHENCSLMPLSNLPGGSCRSFADDLKEKLLIEEDNDQDILDQHVSRVWADTPSRSPKLASPRPRSPDKRRILSQQQLGHHNSQRQSHRRKEKDVFSTFSGDSGNVHDFQDAGDLVNALSMSSLGSNIHKSDYEDSLHQGKKFNLTIHFYLKFSFLFKNLLNFHFNRSRS